MDSFGKTIRNYPKPKTAIQSYLRLSEPTGFLRILGFLPHPGYTVDSPGAIPSYPKSMDSCEKLSGAIQSYPELSKAIRNYPKPMDSCEKLSGAIQSYPELSKAIRNYPKPMDSCEKLSGAIQGYPELSKAIWNYPKSMDSYGKTIRNYPKLSGTIQSYPELSKAIQSYLRLSDGRKPNRFLRFLGEVSSLFLTNQARPGLSYT